MKTSPGTQLQHTNGVLLKAYVDVDQDRVIVEVQSRPFGPSNPEHTQRMSLTYDEYHALADVFTQERVALVADIAERELQANRPAGAIEINHGYSLLVPWDADKDRRPKTKTSRVGDPTYAKWLAGGGRLPSANHGECTPCAKANKLSTATHRQVNARTGSTEISLCAEHVRVATKAPIEVPTFTSAEEAQEWLDRQSDLMEAG